MKLQIEINVPDDALDQRDLELRVRTEIILALLEDSKYSLDQAALELGLTTSEVVRLMSDRRTPGSSPAAGEPQWTQHSNRDMDIVKWANGEIAGKHVPSIEEVRRMLSSIPGLMSDAVIAERGDY